MHSKRIYLTTLVVMLGLSGSNAVWALGTQADILITNDVSLSYTVNAVGQNTTTSTDFRVDRKLIVAVTNDDAGWVTAVPGQSTAPIGANTLPAMNFTIHNDSNDAVDIVLGLIDQDGTQVTGFSAVGASFDEDAIVVAVDVNGNNGYDALDTVIIPVGGQYAVTDAMGAQLAADGTIAIVVAIDIDAAVGADEYAAYTLVAAVATGTAVIDADDSGNISPGSAAAVDDNLNEIAGLDVVFADAGSANAEDEQGDFFPGFTVIVNPDQASDGQAADTGGFVTGIALDIAKYVEVLYDPILGNAYADRDTGSGTNPKSIPGAVLMYVIGVVNPNAALTADDVTVSDDIPDGAPEVVDEGDQANPAIAIVIPNSVSFDVGGVNTAFDLSGVVDLDAVSYTACSAPTSAPDWDADVVLGGADANTLDPEIAGDVGDCAPGDKGFVVYFVTIDNS